MNSTDRANILIVDDRPENLLALEAVLTDPAYRLVRASSGEEALHVLLTMDIAAIILDVRMPGLDGFETATLIKSRDKLRTIKGDPGARLHGCGRLARPAKSPIGDWPQR